MMRWNDTVRAVPVTVAMHRGGMPGHSVLRSAVRYARGPLLRGHSPPAAEGGIHRGSSNSNGLFVANILYPVAAIRARPNRRS